MIRNILVALDGTAIAPRVLATATEIAERFNARMFLFRAVMVPPEFPAAAANTAPPDALPHLLAAQALEELRRLAAGNPRASAETPLIRYGDPWRTIVEAGDRLDVELIVVGSHLYHWPDQLVGTVAAHLATRGHRNVLIVQS
jgi:nucleotide-binding universal stress UspA family protein